MNLGDCLLPEIREARVGHCHVDNPKYSGDENPNVPEVFVLEVHFEYLQWQEFMGYSGAQPAYETFTQITVSEMFLDGQSIDENYLESIVGPDSTRNAIVNATSV